MEYRIHLPKNKLNEPRKELKSPSVDLRISENLKYMSEISDITEMGPSSRHQNLFPLQEVLIQTEGVQSPFLLIRRESMEYDTMNDSSKFLINQWKTLF